MFPMQLPNLNVKRIKKTPIKQWECWHKQKKSGLKMKILTCERDWGKRERGCCWDVADRGNPPSTSKFISSCAHTQGRKARSRWRCWWPGLWLLSALGIPCCMPTSLLLSFSIHGKSLCVSASFLDSALLVLLPRVCYSIFQGVVGVGGTQQGLNWQ